MNLHINKKKKSDRSNSSLNPHQIKTHLQSDSQTHKREIEQFHALVAATPLPSAKDGGLHLLASLIQP